MLHEIGVKQVEELWADIPQKTKLKEPLRFPSALSEPGLGSWMIQISRLGGNLVRTYAYIRSLGPDQL